MAYFLQADKEGSVSKLVSKVGAEAIEMAYWLVKFVGDFEKVFALSRAEDRSDQESINSSNLGIG